MPSIWTTCPKCQRPIETDYEYDGQTVTCPGCDTEMPVPKPVLFRVPYLVWVETLCLMLLPLSVTPGFIHHYSKPYILGPAAFLGLMMAIPGFALVRGNYMGWLVLLILASLCGVIGLSVSMLGLAMTLLGPIGESFLWGGVPLTLVSAANITLLVIPTIREWCKQKK